MALIQLGTDDFNRSNEAIEASNGWAYIGGSSGGITVSGNKLAWVTSGRAAYQETSHADHYVQGVIQNVGNNSGCPLMVRCVDTSNWVGVRVSGGNYQILEDTTAGGVVQIGVNVSAASAAVSDVWRLEAEGSNIRFYVNDGLVMTRTPTDTTATKAGTINRVGALDPILDDMVWGYIGTAGGFQAAWAHGANTIIGGAIL